MLVSQLYEPSRDLEKLDLPIISWPIDVTSLVLLKPYSIPLQDLTDRHGEVSQPKRASCMH